MLSTSEAANIIGCTVRHIRHLRKKGILKGRQKHFEDGTFVWELTEASVFQYAQSPPSGKGWRRGLSNQKVM